MSIYEKLTAAGCKTDHHESDLYVEKTAQSLVLLADYEFRCNVREFRNQIDGKVWLDVPFAFDPWWAKRATA